MKLQFLGSGSAFTVNGQNWQSNMLIESLSGKRLLIDCGSDIRFSLSEQGLSPKHIDAIYISHLHADHVGGMEWLGFATHFGPSKQHPKLFGNDEVLDDLWEHSLSGGMSGIQGAIANLGTYFDVQKTIGEGQFAWEGVTFQMVDVQHIDDGTRQLPSYGLEFSLNGKQAFLTTDTQFTPQKLFKHYEASDIIFHDCETIAPHTPVHAHYDELTQLPAHIRAKIWLYHYQPGSLPDAVADGFQGFVVKGQTFT